MAVALSFSPASGQPLQPVNIVITGLAVDQTVYYLAIADRSDAVVTDRSTLLAELSFVPDGSGNYTYTYVPQNRGSLFVVVYGLLQVAGAGATLSVV